MVPCKLGRPLFELNGLVSVTPTIGNSSNPWTHSCILCVTEAVDLKPEIQTDISDELENAIDLFATRPERRQIAFFSLVSHTS